MQGQVTVEVAGSEAVEPVANALRGLSGAGPAMVAAYSFILRKTDENRPLFSQRSRIAVPELNHFTQARIIRTARQPLGRRHRLQPRKPPGRA